MEMTRTMVKRSDKLCRFLDTSREGSTSTASTVSSVSIFEL